jgi:Kef-type K+ transport system membrane component KefB
MLEILFQIFVAFTAARILGRLFARFGQPAVVGELLAGALLGPFLLGVLHESEILEALGELGVIMLLFMAGLDTHVEELTETKTSAVLVALLGAALPFGFGLAAGSAFGFPLAESLFVGTALMATSVGITVRVLRDLGFHRRRSVRIILAAAVLDDVLGLLVLSLVTAYALGRANVVEFGLLLVEAIVFVAVIGFLGPRIVARIGEWLAGYPAALIFEVGIIAMLALSLLAEWIGLAAIVGAFLAGLAVSELKQHTEVEERFAPLSWFFMPFFFVLMGTYLDLGSFSRGIVLVEVVAFSIIAVLTKYIGSLIGARREGRRVAQEVGVGMIPRGEVGIVVAGIALDSGALGGGVYAAVIGMVLVTTVGAPYLIKVVFGRSARRRKAAGEAGA